MIYCLCCFLKFNLIYLFHFSCVGFFCLFFWWLTASVIFVMCFNTEEAYMMPENTFYLTQHFFFYGTKYFSIHCALEFLFLPSAAIRFLEHFSMHSDFVR